MVRTAKAHQLSGEEGDEGEDLTPTTTADASSHRDGKGSEQKPNNSRSKHSETEQRRRSKINERFQILRDLIPPNDQKRDKASLLLEVIEYIQFLQDKVQMYEGSYQGWNQEPAKLIPWRSSQGVGENIPDQYQIMMNGSGHDNSMSQPIQIQQSSVESDYCGDGTHRGTDHLGTAGPGTPALPLNMPLLPGTSPSERGMLPAENLASQPELQAWNAGTSIAECAIAGNVSTEPGSAQERCRSSISNVYSQGKLLKSLTEALQTSGVDLSQTSISVELDVGKNASSSQIASTSSAQGNLAAKSEQPATCSGKETDANESNQVAKRIRTLKS